MTSWNRYIQEHPEHPEHLIRKDPEKLRAFEELNKKIQEELAERRAKKARFKLEVIFGSGRTPLGQPNGNPCTITVYESGRRLHGGGDDLAWWCERRDWGAGEQVNLNVSTHKIRAEKHGCGKVIVSDNIVSKTVPAGPDGLVKSVRTAVCPHCTRVWPASQLTDSIMGRWSTRRLAQKLAELWRQTDGDSDIYLKYHHTDIRYVTMENLHGTQTARMLRGMAIYPLQNILKDTGGGAALEDRLYVFLQQ